MEWNQEMLNKFLSMDDAQLRAQLCTLAQAAGIDQAAAQRATADMRTIRAKLDGISDREAERILAQLGPDAVQKLTESLQGK